MGAAPRVRLGGGRRLPRLFGTSDADTTRYGFWNLRPRLLGPLSLVAGSTWLLDAVRPLLPVTIQLYYRTHPRAVHSERMVVGAALVIMWALRLFRAHGRRYQWALSSKEDWRRADLRLGLRPEMVARRVAARGVHRRAGRRVRARLPLRSLAGFAGAGVPFLPSFEDD